MMRKVGSHLPRGWSYAKINEIAEVNPRLNLGAVADSLAVTFVPMTAVEAETGAIDLSRTKRLSEVRRGYRSFHPGDVLFAKITPCMENGKMAVVPKLENGVGFGSTEFHVLRPRKDVCSDYVYWYVSESQFRREAERHMTGAVGQRRVPTSYLGEQTIPLPPAKEQHRIVAKIQELFSELRSGVDSLMQAHAQLANYRHAVLKHAFDGKLTARWRKENRGKLDTREQLVARICHARDVRYERQLKEWRSLVYSWENGSKAKKRPTRPKMPTAESSPTEDVRSRLDAIPSSWLWLAVEAVGTVQLGRQRSPKNRSKNHPTKYIRAANITESGLNTDSVLDMEFLPHELPVYRLETGDLLLSEASGSADQVGKPAIWKDQIPNCCFQNTVIRHRSYDLEFAPYLLWLYRYYFVSGRFSRVAGGVGINHLTASKFSQMMFPFCSLKEQREIVSRLEGWFSAIEQRESEVIGSLKRADELRQAILSKAFAGQLVAQCPSDEPASILLDRIRAEREPLAERTTRRVGRHRSVNAIP